MATDIKIYRDDDANAVVIEEVSVGMKFNKELQAIGNGDGTCTVQNIPKTINGGFNEIANVIYSRFVDANGATYGNDETEVCNALNTVFQNVGSQQPGFAPEIIGATSINITSNEVINYTIQDNYGVGYRWENLPAGLTTKNGDDRTIIGLVSNGVGTYTPEATVVNYYGTDTQTITISVTSSFVNTRSIEFTNNDYMDATANTSNPLYRPSNGSGSSDAWTISCWVKINSSNNNQTILMFGGSDQDNEGRVRLWHSGGNRSLIMEYGTNNNYIRFETPASSVPQNVWTNIIVTYDGGTTGSASGSINDYYGRFEIWIGGSSQTNTNSHSNYGYSGEIVDDYFRIAENGNSSNHIRDGIVDEIAIWDSDQTANVATIYNSGVPHDLSLIGTPPTHWWRMGDGDTFPTIEDNIGSLDFTMFNMTVSDIVNDVPN